MSQPHRVQRHRSSSGLLAAACLLYSGSALNVGTRGPGELVQALEKPAAGIGGEKEGGGAADYLQGVFGSNCLGSQRSISLRRPGAGMSQRHSVQRAQRHTQIVDRVIAHISAIGGDRNT